MITTTIRFEMLDEVKIPGIEIYHAVFKVIDKAKESCENAGQNIADHFPDVRKTIPMPEGAEKEIEVSYRKSGFCCKCAKEHGRA